MQGAHNDNSPPNTPRPPSSLGLILSVYQPADCIVDCPDDCPDDSASDEQRLEAVDVNTNTDTVTDTTVTETIQNCLLCSNDFKLPIKLSCGHTFCFYCIKPVYSCTRTCPRCYSSITKQEIEDASIDEADMEKSPTLSDHVWLYEARNISQPQSESRWWQFDPQTSSLLEEGYLQYETDMAAIRASTDKNMPLLVPSSVCKSFWIGSFKYIARYDLNIQYREDIPSRQRNIRRVVCREIDEELIRGIAGLKVTKKKDA